MKLLFSYALCIGLVLTSGGIRALTLSEQLLNKVEPVILEKAKIGTPQQVLIVLDQSDIDAQMKARRASIFKSAASGASSTVMSAQQVEENERILSAETSTKLQALKDQVFPQGRHNLATVHHSFSHLPVVAVTITDLDSLLSLLKDPRILKVEQMPTVVPTGQQNLQLIDQPVTADKNRKGENTRVAVLDGGAYVPLQDYLGATVFDAWELIVFNERFDNPQFARSKNRCGLELERCDAVYMTAPRRRAIC